MSNLQPEVSVVIPCRNGGEYLQNQLEHLCRQNNAPSFEVIISDNGSSDGSPQKAIEKFSDKILLRLVDSSKIPGVSYARNRGASAAHGKYLLFCDADDYVENNWIFEIYSAFIRTSADIVGGDSKYLTVNPPNLLKAYSITSKSDSNFERFSFENEMKPFSNYKPSVAGCNFAVKRELYLRAGGMDLSYKGGSEETDFTWRVLNLGAKLVFANQAFVNYRLRNSFKGIFKQQYNYQKTKVLLWVRFRDNGMSGQSFKYSVASILKNAPLLLSEGKRLRAANVIGGNMGALAGIFWYRILKKIPARNLMQ